MAVNIRTLITNSMSIMTSQNDFGNTVIKFSNGSTEEYNWSGKIGK